MQSPRPSRSPCRGARGPRPAVLALLAALFVAGAACERPADPRSGSAAVDGPGGSAYTPPATGLVIVDPPAPYVTPDKIGDPQERAYFHDFGHVLFGEVLERTFHLENREGRAVTIHDLLPNCGCTMPDVLARTRDGEVLRGNKEGDGPLLVVPDGAALEVRIRIDTRRAPFLNKDKLAMVRMRTDASDPFTTFELHLLIEQALSAEPGTIDLGLVPTTIGGTGSAWLRATQPESGTRVGGVDSVDGPLTARLEEEERLGIALWKLVVEADPGLPIGALRGVVRVTVQDGEGRPDPARFEVQVVGRVVHDVVLDPPALHLTAPADDGPATATAELSALIPGARVRVVSTGLEGEGSGRLVLRAVPTDPDSEGRAARWTIVLEAPADAEPHSVSGRVRIALDDPSLPEISAPFTSSVR